MDISGHSAATRALRQRTQIILGLVVAALLLIAIFFGSIMARDADARINETSERLAAHLLRGASENKQAEFHRIVRDHFVDALPGLSVAARAASLTLFTVDAGHRLREIDDGLRTGPGVSRNVAQRLAAPIVETLRSGGVPVRAGFVSDGGVAGLVLVEKLAVGAAKTSPNGASQVIGVWSLTESTLTGKFSEHGLMDARLSAMPDPAADRGGLAIETERGKLYLSWPLATDSAQQWIAIRTFVLLALIGVIAKLVFSMRFSHRAELLVREIEKAAYDRATRDPLTGLHNRSGFKMRLDEALEARATSALVGVVYIDLDRFKEVNDGFGHETGDRLLIAVTERLRHLTGPNVTIARLGGDEFALVVEQRTDPLEIVEMGENISLQLGMPFLLGSTEVVIGGSVGIAIAPDDGVDSTELVRRADISMYRAKTSGRGQAFRFDTSMEDEIRRRKVLEGELRHAIAREQLEVWYQPVLASDGETLVGTEALLRWRHPTEGLISPAVFIPLAEETGQIVEIGEWMMNRALTDALNWPGIQIAMNVSPVQFRRKDIVESTMALAQSIGVEPERIEVEITEGVLMEDAEAAIAIIQGFRSHGMHVALDDFGTGYASLSYLRRFPFDKLKVDQAFVRNLGVASGSAAIIHSVIALGRSLGMTVHAEGVETLEHHIFLRAAGCHHFQGYYFSKPMPREEMDAFAARKQAAGPRLALRA